MLAPRYALASLAFTLAACTSDAREPTTFRAGESDSETSETDTGEDPPDTDLLATCSAAELQRAPANLRGSLRPFVETITFDVPPIGLDCGLGEGGPIGFVRVEIPSRADLHVRARGVQVVPRVAILQAGCASEALDPDRLLACADTLPLVVEDLRPGTELLFAIGAASDDPALTSPKPQPGAFDPLEVEVELSLRTVIDEGSACSPALGRCETGTLCVVDGDDARCRRPDADSCANPTELELLPAGESLVLTIDTSEPHGDAHAHACTGWRQPDRVHRLLLPAEISPTARLEIVADDPRVGLALRLPDCLPEHAQACVPADLQSGPHALIVGQGQLPSWAAQGIAALLFVELPSDEHAANLGVSLTIVEP